VVVDTIYENDDTFYDYRPHEFAIWEVYAFYVARFESLFKP
jgi:hypothetical protein